MGISRIDMGLGVLLVHKLAADEAVNGNAEEIELGHMLCAVLKLAELPEGTLRRVLQDDRMVSILVEEQHGLCAALNAAHIRVPDDTTLIRRSLRMALRGPQPVPRGGVDGTLHRSSDCKSLFERVAVEATMAGDRVITVDRLVARILAEPDERLAEVLPRFGIQIHTTKHTKGRGDFGWVEMYGVDLTRESLGEDIQPGRLEALRRDAMCRVVAEAAVGAHRLEARPLLLVSFGARSASLVMRDVALWISRSDSIPIAQRVRLVEIRTDTILNYDGDVASGIQAVLDMAGADPTTVLFFDEFHRYLVVAHNADWERRVRYMLQESKNLCIMGMTGKQYETHVRHSDIWSNSVKVIVIHEIGASFQL